MLTLHLLNTINNQKLIRIINSSSSNKITISNNNNSTGNLRSKPWRVHLALSLQIQIPLIRVDSLPVLLLSIVLNQTLWVKTIMLFCPLFVISSFAAFVFIMLSRQAYFHVCGTCVRAHLHIDVDEIVEYVWQQGTNRAIPLALNGRVSSCGTSKKKKKNWCERACHLEKKMRMNLL